MARLSEETFKVTEDPAVALKPAGSSCSCLMLRLGTSAAHVAFDAPLSFAVTSSYRSCYRTASLSAVWLLFCSFWLALRNENQQRANVVHLRGTNDAIERSNPRAALSAAVAPKSSQQKARARMTISVRSQE